MRSASDRSRSSSSGDRLITRPWRVSPGRRDTRRPRAGFPARHVHRSNPARRTSNRPTSASSDGSFLRHRSLTEGTRMLSQTLDDVLGAGTRVAVRAQSPKPPARNPIHMFRVASRRFRTNATLNVAAALATAGVASTFAVAPATALAVWSAPADLSASGQNARGASLAVNDAGDAVFAWRRFDGSDDRIQAQTRSAAGVLGLARTLSASGRPAF